MTSCRSDRCGRAPKQPDSTCRLCWSRPQALRPRETRTPMISYEGAMRLVYQPAARRNPAGKDLEVDPEVRLHNFLPAAGSGVAKDQIVFGALTESRWQCGVQFLIVRSLGVENCLDRTSVEEVGKLPFIHQKEIDISSVIARRPNPLLHKRAVGSTQLRVGSMSRDFKGQVHDTGNGKRFM